MAFLWPNTNVDHDDNFEIADVFWRFVQTSHFFFSSSCTAKTKSFPMVLDHDEREAPFLQFHSLSTAVAEPVFRRNGNFEFPFH